MPWLNSYWAKMQKHYHWLLGFFCLMVRQYQAKECQKSAASLTYVTLFATVPMMTVTYSMFSVIPAFQSLGDQFQSMLFDHLLPNSEQDLGKYLKEFSAQARQLTAAGLAFLTVSAYLMLKNIEANFNAIWGVARGRRGVANFLLYWAVLSLGPLLLGAALAMNTYLTSFRLVVGHYDSLGLIETVLQLAPWLLTWAAFTLLFVAVPNCKVPVAHGLIGGLVTTLFFQALKSAFGWIVSHSSFTLVYGAFAAVPLFLLWVNLIWTVILGGAVFVHTINAHEIGLRDRNYPDLLACLLVLWRCYQASKDGVAVPERALLREGLSSDQWLRISEALVKHRVLTTNYQGDYLLCHDLKSLRLLDLVRILSLPDQLPKDGQDSLADLPWGAEAQAHLGAIDDFARERLQRSVDSLFSCVPPTKTDPSGEPVNSPQ